jgi:hypothetical protein
MKGITFLTLGTLIIMLFATYHVYACSCGPPRPISLDKQVEEAVNQDEAIFLGKVIRIGRKDSIFTEVVFQVDRVWKGNLFKTVSVDSGFTVFGCKYPFKVGESYLVYAYGDKEYLGVDNCSRMEKLTDAKEDLKILGEDCS